VGSWQQKLGAHLSSMAQIDSFATTLSRTVDSALDELNGIEILMTQTQAKLTP
jgi:hypothetical protein